MPSIIQNYICLFHTIQAITVQMSTTSNACRQLIAYINNATGTNYTDAKVVGLQYEGHLATAVCFGDNVNIGGDMFSYGGKKYYVCDPTYINASIGMTMPQFKGKMPKIIKMTK